MTRVASSARYHVSRVKVINPVYNGLERSKMVLKWSVFSRSIQNGLERTIMVLKGRPFFMYLTRLYGLIAGFWFVFDTFGGWSWNDTFTCLFSMEGYQFSSNGLERSLLMTQICSSVFSMGFCHLFILDGLERSFSCCLVSFSQSLKQTEMFLHKTFIRPNLMLAGWPTMIGFGVFISTM